MNENQKIIKAITSLKRQYMTNKFDNATIKPHLSVLTKYLFLIM